MHTEIYFDRKSYIINTQDGIDLSIKNDFSNRGPVFFNANHPTSHPQKSNGFIGNIKEGGSCNVPIVSLNIHCTGTHTESIAHISDRGEKIPEVCPLGLISAYLLTVKLTKSDDTNELYHCELSDDLLITAKKLKNKLSDKYEALIIRTNPNNQSKLIRNYDQYPAPFFTNDAIEYINSYGIKHLLVDIPSIDKANDGGSLGNHRLFFEKGKTISELLFIPEEVKDGFGLLQIQIPNWELDASPSRPIFYPVEWFSFLI